MPVDGDEVCVEWAEAVKARCSTRLLFSPDATTNVTVSNLQKLARLDVTTPLVSVGVQQQCILPEEPRCLTDTMVQVMHNNPTVKALAIHPHPHDSVRVVDWITATIPSLKGTATSIPYRPPLALPGRGTPWRCGL